MIATLPLRALEPSTETTPSTVSVSSSTRGDLAGPAEIRGQDILLPDCWVCDNLLPTSAEGAAVDTQPRGVAIVGIGETPNARHLPKEMSALLIDAILMACEDAGIAPAELDGVVTESFTMPTELSEVALTLGMKPDAFVAHVAFSGAGTVAAPELAAMAIETGRATNVVCFFGAKYGSLAGGPFSFHGADPLKANFELPYGLFPQPAYMALMAQRYLEEFGYSQEDFAHVAMTSPAWAAMHPTATKREGLTLDQYLQSPMVAAPLRNADCALLSDGAAAFIMTSA